MHYSWNMLGTLVRPKSLRWFEKWKRYVRTFDFAKTRHNQSYWRGLLTDVRASLAW